MAFEDAALGFLGMTPRSTEPRTRGLTIARDGGVGWHVQSCHIHPDDKRRQRI